MSDQQPGQQPCNLTIERVGDTVIAVLPAGGQHYEITMSRTLAMRFGAALVRVGVDDTQDSLDDVQLGVAIDSIGGNQ